MRIAYFTSNRTTIPPNPSHIVASTTQTLTLIDHLKERHEITLYAAQGSKLPGVEIVDLDLPPFEVDSSHTDRDWITKAVVGMKQLYIGALMADAYRYDVIHLQTEPIYLGMPYAPLLKTPVLFTTHNAYHSLEKTIFEFADKNKITISALSKSHALSLPFSRQIPFIYNGIEIKKYPADTHGGDSFLFFGRFVKDKGILEYLSLAERNKEISFRIAGQGIESQAVEEASQHAKNIETLGMLSRESKGWFDVLRTTRALIAPVQWEEPFGLVFVEAMACGTPVIAYARGSVPEIVEDGRTGFIVNASREDVRGDFVVKKTGQEGLQEAVERMISMDAGEYIQMRKECRKRVEDLFTADKMVARYEDLYTKLSR